MVLCRGSGIAQRRIWYIWDDEQLSFSHTLQSNCRRRYGVGREGSNVFVLISYQIGSNLPRSCVARIFADSGFLFCFFFHRINKRGSQKDQEQKKSGNYFFYDDGADDDDDDDFDDL